ncbi:unnamed protein product, partial [Prorocentrum cordatum]
ALRLTRRWAPRRVACCRRGGRGRRRGGRRGAARGLPGGMRRRGGGELSRLLGNLRSTLQDGNYCTGREARITWLVARLSPLTGPDAAAALLHPSSGARVRASLREALERWDEAEPDELAAEAARPGGPREAKF